MMTPLRRRMIDDLRLRNYSPSTVETYVSHIARFAVFHKRSPEKLGPEAVREYQLHLLESQVSWSLFNQNGLCAEVPLSGHAERSLSGRADPLRTQAPEPPGRAQPG